MTDCWPEGIELTDMQSPKDILVAAKEQWHTRSDGALGLVIQEATSTTGHAMLVVHAKHEPTNRTLNLFTVVHRQTAPYPVTIQPREDELPPFLKKSYYAPSLADIGRESLGRAMSEGRTVANKWVAESPAEFRTKLKEAFNLGTVKAGILAVVTGGADLTPGAGSPTQGTGESSRSEEESEEGGGESVEGTQE